MFKVSKRIHVGDIKINKEGKERIKKILEEARISEGRNVQEFEKTWIALYKRSFKIKVYKG